MPYVELHKETALNGALPGTNVSLLVLLSTQHSGTHFISSVLRSLPDTTFGDEALSQCGVQQCKGLAGKALGACMRAPTNLSMFGFVRQALPLSVENCTAWLERTLVHGCGSPGCQEVKLALALKALGPEAVAVVSRCMRILPHAYHVKRLAAALKTRVGFIWQSSQCGSPLAQCTAAAPQSDGNGCRASNSDEVRLLASPGTTTIVYRRDNTLARYLASSNMASGDVPKQVAGDAPQAASQTGGLAKHLLKAPPLTSEISEEVLCELDEDGRRDAACYEEVFKALSGAYHAIEARA